LGLIWRLHDADPGLAQPRAKGRAPLRVPVTDQHGMAAQDPFVRGGERAADLAHEHLSGSGGGPTTYERREGKSITKTV